MEKKEIKQWVEDQVHDLQERGMKINYVMDDKGRFVINAYYGTIVISAIEKITDYKAISMKDLVCHILASYNDVEYGMSYADTIWRYYRAETGSPVIVTKMTF